MKNRLIAAAVAAALALSSVGVTPATALDNDEALGLALGAITLGLILNETNKRKSYGYASPNRSYQPYRPYYGFNDDRRYFDDRDDRQVYKRKYAHKRQKPYGYARRQMIPAQCVFPIRSGYGRREVVSARCLSEFGRGYRLPDDCAFRIRDRWGNRTVYGTNCLQNRGFQIARVR